MNMPFLRNLDTCRLRANLSRAGIWTVVGLAGCLAGCHIQNRQAAVPAYIDPGCPRLRGLGATVRGDLIHNRESVIKISEIIIHDFYKGSEGKYSTGVEVVDLGKSWGVTEVLRKSIYGSDLKFSINKCSGAIENFHIEE